MENNNNGIKDELVDFVVDGNDLVATFDNSNKMQRSAYAAVIFLNVAEMYPADAHVECKYTLTDEIIPSSRDWIGLYKVGWMSAKDYYYYEWAPLPKNYKPETEATAEILFQAHNLPKDDGEFYQFCYVASGGQIRGASTPFQFKKPSANDYVEIEDLENDMMIVREKKTYLEENLKEATIQKAALLQQKNEIMEEKKQMKKKQEVLKKQLSEEKSKSEQLQKKLLVKTEELEESDKNTHSMLLLHAELTAKIESLTKQLDSAEKEIASLTKDIATMKEKMVTLQNEKDGLEGENKMLQEEKEMVKGHLSQSEGKASNLAREMTVMQKAIQEKDGYIAACQMEIATLKSSLHQYTQRTEQQDHVMASNIETVEKLKEKLRNTEDKLEAAVKIKEIMSNEMSAYSSANDDLKKERDTFHNENLELKKDIERMETEFAKETELLRKENENTRMDLTSAVKEKEALQKSVSSLQDEQKKNTTTASMYALKLANSALTERHRLMEAELEKKQASARTIQKEASEIEKQLRREITDLKERITMCSDAYRQLYKENVKLQKKCKHCRSRVNGEKMESSSVEADQKPKESSHKEVEVSQKREPSVESVTYIMTTECNTDTESKTSSSESKDNNDVKAKLNKYVKLYQSEWRKNETMERQHSEEMKKKDEVISSLKVAVRSRTTELEHKHMSCTSFLAEKDKQIEELNKTLRELKQENAVLKMQENDGKYAVPSCQLLYGNPYLQQFQSNEATPLPPLVYPHRVFTPQTTPDPLNETEGTAGLPAPITPTVLPSAKAAAVRAACFNNTDDQSEVTFVDARSEWDKTIPSAPFELEEDKFVDAKGVGMKICSVCNMSFSPDISDIDFERHVLTHSGRICPICNHLADENTSDNDFIIHVNGCIDKGIN